MNIAIIPKLLLDKIETEIFSKEDIKIYIKSLVDILELNNYYKGTLFDSKQAGLLATYNFSTYYMRIFYEMMITERKFLNKETNFPLVLITNL